MAIINVSAGGDIQAAINAANTGDTIRIAAGTFSGNFTLNKGLTIEGVNKGVDGAAARAAETIFTGTWTVATSDKVKIDGVEFLDNKAMPTLTISDNFQSVVVLTTSAAGHEITNSVFMRAPSSVPAGFSSTTFAGSNSQPTHRGVEISNVTAGTSVSVTHNLFTGTNPYSYAGDSWRSAVYSNGGAGTTNITNNTFTNVRSGVNADSFTSAVHIDNNKFDHSGTGVTFGVGSDIANITTVNNNSFGAGVDGEFSLRNVTTAASFDVAGKGNVLTASGPTEMFSVEGTATAPFAFKGTVSNDLFTGNAVGDTATVAGNLTSASFSTASGTWKVATAAQGTDTLVGVEKVTDGAGKGFLLVGSGSSYTSIQTAINAAANGDTILVAAGTYHEQLYVNGKSNITIKAVGAVTVDAPAGGLAQSGGSLVTAANARAGYEANREVFALAAVKDSTNVQIQGVTFDGHHTSTGIAGTNPQLVGVYYQNSSGGLDQVKVLDISDPMSGGQVSGVQRGFGVYVDNTSVKDFKVTATDISGFQKNGMYVKYANVDLSGLHITGNGPSTTNAQNGIVIYDSTGTIHDNTIDGIGYAGATVYSTDIYALYSTNLTIANNTIVGTEASTTASKAVGIYLIEPNGATVQGNTISYIDTAIESDNPSTNVKILNNTIHHIDGTDTYFAGASGIDFEAPYANLTASGNTVDLTGASGTITLNFLTLTASDIVYNAANNNWTAKGVTLSSGNVTDAAGNHFYLVGPGSSIQSAINAASAGDKIMIAAGTYNEKVIVNKAGMTLVGYGDVNITGTFRTDNGIAAGTKISTWLETAASYNGNSGAVVRVEANDVTLTNLNVKDSLIGVAANGQIQNLTMNQVDISSAVFGFEKVGPTAYFVGAVDSNLNGLTINQGSIKDVYLGMDIPKSNTVGNNLTNVSINGTAFEDITHKGIYAETLSNATITGVTMNHVGYYGNGPAFGSVAPGAGQSSNGIELNLKYGAYSNVTITGFNFTDVGTSTGPTTNVNAGAIVVKTRGDATDTSYVGNPATWTGAPLVISNGSINGTYTGIKIGEAGKQSVGPNVVSTNVTITNELDAGVVNNSTATFSGGPITTNGHTFSTLNLGPSNKILLVDATHYTTIQAAIDASIAGDVVVIKTGTYAENLTVNKSLQLIASGAVTVHPASGNVLTITGNLGGKDVVVDGLDLQGVQGAGSTGVGVFVNTDANVGKLSLVSTYIHDNGAYGVFVDGEAAANSAAKIDILSSTFAHNGYNGVNGAAHIKLYGFKGDANISNTSIVGGSGGVGAANLPNLPDYGIELHGTPNPALTSPVMGSVKLTNVTVSGDFHKSGLAINNYSEASGLGMTNVNLSGVQTNWVPVFITDGIAATYSAANYGLILPTRDHVTELQGDVTAQPATSQLITGTKYNDWLMGKGGNDILVGGDGNDYLFGADKDGGAAAGDAGNDTLDGGAGDDFLFGAAGTDTAVYHGAHWQYTFSKLAGGEIVINGSAVGEGTDTVTGVEMFQFTDGVYTAANVLTPTTAPVVPDPGPTGPSPAPDPGPTQPNNGNNPGTGTGNPGTGTGNPGTGTGTDPNNPSSGQNPGGAAQTNTSGGVMTGVDPTSTKGTSPTITLPDGRVVPNDSYLDAQQLALFGQQYEAGTITKAQLIDKIADLSIDTTSVALTTFQFFTGSTPSKAGLAYLVNSPDNLTDLTDPYYAQFSDSNLYINFAVDQGLRGAGATAFLTNYGNLSFEDAARKAYAAIIGNGNAAAAGINIDQAIAGIMAQQKYFTDVSGGTLQGAKAAMVGYLMYEGMKAHIGTYYNATHAWYENAFNGTVGSQVNLLGTTSAMIPELT